MKRKGNRTVTLSIPCDNFHVIQIQTTLDQLKLLYKEALKNQMETIPITCENVSGELTIKQLRSSIISLMKQFNAQKLIPRDLRDYLVCNPSGVYAKTTGRDEELERIWTYLLSKKKSNAILIGEHGVGKTTIATEVMRQINLGECPKQFSKYNFVTINTDALLEFAHLAEKSSSFYRIKYIKIIETIKDFAKRNKERVIFYIDNLLHVKCDLELLKLFKNLFSESNAKFIASVNSEDFKYYFNEDDEFMKYANNILIEEPENEEIYSMIKNRIDALQAQYDVNISKRMVDFAILTAGFHADYNRQNPEKTIDAINFALADAQRKGQKEVTKQNFFTYYNINFKEIQKMPKKREEEVAYHEVGHCLLGLLLPNIRAHKIINVSILPSDDYGGVTVHHYDLTKYEVCSMEYYIDFISYLLGGRVGEMLYTNTFSVGAVSDLSKANAIAEETVLEYGLATIDNENSNKTYITGGYAKYYLLTDEVKTKVNEEIANIMQEAFKRAKETIDSNRALFDEIVQRVLEEKIIVYDELKDICKKYGIELE